MDLRLTIMTPNRVGALTDVVVDAPPGTPLEAVLPELREAVGVAGSYGETCCQGLCLDIDHLLGTPPLVEGAVLVLGRADRPDPPCSRRTRSPVPTPDRTGRCGSA